MSRRMDAKPEVRRATAEAVSPRHKAQSRLGDEIPNYRRLNEKRQAQYRQRHHGAKV